MSIWVIICATGIILLIPIHFRSVEHIKLNERYGEEKGKRIGEILGIISGWGYFMFLIGLWISPQVIFVIFPEYMIIIPIVNFHIGVVNAVISICFLIPGAYLGIVGVKATGVKVSETHRAEFLVTEGIYTKIRHPQYLGAFLSHIGMSFLFSAGYSMVATLLVLLSTYLTSKKEEVELINEFGEAYKIYQSRVPMFIPRAKK